MEVSKVDLQSSLDDKLSDFETEVDAVSSQENDLLECNSQEACDEVGEIMQLIRKKKRAKMFEKKKVLRVQKERMLQQCLLRKREILKRLRFQDSSTEQRCSPMVHNLSFLNKSPMLESSVDRKVNVTNKISPIGTHASIISSQDSKTYNLYYQNIILSPTSISPFFVGDNWFGGSYRYKRYRVLYRGKYYLFEFEGADMKGYCEAKHDCP